MTLTVYQQLRATKVYFGNKLIMQDGNTVGTDRLGSVRSGGSAPMSYFPYGEERTGTANGQEKFGTYYRDPNGDDYAMARYYQSSSGRFATADPMGMKAAVAGTPMSWNRMAYVGGDPVNYDDHDGLLRHCATGTHVVYPDGPFSGTCVSDGTAGGGGSSGRKPARKQPGDVGTDSGGANPTPNSQKGIQGFNEAFEALQNPQCASALGATSVSAAVQGLQFGVNIDPNADLGNDLAVDGTGHVYGSILGGTWVPGTNDINLNGDIGNPSAVLAGYNSGVAVYANVPMQIESLFSLPAGSIDNNTFWALMLLHEFGHFLGGLPIDGGDGDLSIQNTGTVLSDCFGLVGH